MASGSQSDTSLWLHNKLGTSNDSWTGGSIVAQLNPDRLVNIQHVFQDLQPQVKLKLLLSFFHIPRRNLEQWRRELEGILIVAKDDSEPWVCMLAELMKSYPESGQLSNDVSLPDGNRKIFNDLLSDLKKALKKSSVLLSEGSRKEHYVLPLECHYLNKNAFMSVVGHQPQAIKHFTLRRKPKAAALRAELLNKSSEAANKVRTNTTAFPVRKSTMPRKMSEATAYKSLPSRSSGLGTSGFVNRNARMALNPNKKEGGVKLLDITEQPIGQAAMKKRKRQQELEDAKKFAEESKAEANKPELPVNNKHTKETPDYAVGLSTLNPPTPAPPPAYAPPTPAYAPPTPSMPVTVPTAPTVVSIAPPAASNTVLLQQPQLPTAPLPLTSTTPALPTQPLPVTAAGGQGTTRLTSIPLGLNQLQPLPQSALPSTTQVVRLPTQPQPRVTLQASATGQATARIVQLPTQPIPQNRVAQMTATGARQPPPVSVLSNNLQPGARIIRTIQTPSINAPRQVIYTPQPANPPAPQPQVQQAPAPQVRKQLTLTKEQMFEAQEMFRTANKVTRPEKALILGFMAGSRDNPCPHLGNVVTIKLSENQESVLQNDGTYLTMIVEIHFQMNYSSGEWKRIKKYRRLEE